MLLRPGRTGRIAGVVLDADGRPVEGALVFVDEVDPRAHVAEHDPFGRLPAADLVMLTGMHMCGPMPQCLSRATTDDAGRFELEVPEGAEVTVLASLEGRSASAVTSSKGGRLTLRLANNPPLRVRLVDAEGRATRGTVRAASGRDNLRVVDQELRVGEDGEARLERWPGVPVTFSVRAGTHLEFPEGKPPEVETAQELDEIIF